MPPTVQEHDGHLRLSQEIVAEQFMPTARIMLTRKFAIQGCSQRDIDARLGITQAAVSKYLSRETTVENRFVENTRMNKVTEQIVSGWLDDELDAYDAMGLLLDLVTEFEDRGPICALHEEAMPILEGLGCDLCVRERTIS